MTKIIIIIFLILWLLFKLKNIYMCTSTIHSLFYSFIKDTVNPAEVVPIPFVKTALDDNF